MASCSRCPAGAATSAPISANGTVDDQDRLVCPWHASAYDVRSGRMVRGPQGAFAKVPGLGCGYRALTKVLPLQRGEVVERDGCLVVRERRGDGSRVRSG